MMVGTTEAAKLLRICTQRVRQLLYEGRIKGAKKVGRFWEIPLYGTKPKV
ncbi:MAG: helix-turn-helix domain-containing protein, partial [Cyanobacteriota bacterium]|nr:helix-turn-helix domain-containing protein [Cyanobacteriota bacterium]